MGSKLVALLGLLTFVVITLGVLFFSLAFGSGISRLNGLAYSGVALIVGAIVWLVALLFSPFLASISIFSIYTTLFQETIPGALQFFSNPILSSALSIIVIIEIGMLGGYGIGRSYRTSKESDLTIENPRQIEERPFVHSNRSSYSANNLTLPDHKPLPANPTTLRVENQRKEFEAPLNGLERTIIQLLLFGGVSEIKPKLDDKRPEGYYYEELKGLELDTKSQAIVLSSLAKRAFLSATAREKILHCSRCDAINLEFQGTCPDCGSLSLSKQKVLEHFPCGMIEKESEFRTANGDLLCPKCNKKLELIGNDYRSLGPMYICQNCGALSKELNPVLKCRNCGFSSSPDEEREEYLFSYTINQESLQKIRQFVKPTETIVNHFRSLGHTIYSPAFVRGRSGTEQTFDLMVQKDIVHFGQNYPQSSQSRILFDILASDRPIELEEITREYGKISDVNYKVIVVVIPILSEKARNYAMAYGISVCEGRNIEETLKSAENLVRNIFAEPDHAISSNVQD